MSDGDPPRDLETLFPGGGMTGALVRAVDWSANPLGPVRRWPMSLQAIVRMMLSTRQATCLFWGPDLINLYNDGFVPLLGEKHPQAMGQRARECWSDAWPVVGGLLAGVVEKGEAVLFAEMLIPIVRGGHLEDAWWNYSYSPAFDDEGAIAGVLVVATETTAEVAGRKQLEAAKHEAELARQELQAVFMQAPLPMALLKGPEHRFSLVNEPYRALVTRDVRDKTLREAFSDEEVGYYRPFLDGVYQTGEPVTLHEAPLRLPDDAGVVRDRFIDVGYHPYRDADGTIAGVLAVIHDVTVQVTARMRESALRQVAEAASGAKDEFLAMVSHELRNPLNAILGWSRILSSRERDARRLDKGLEVIDRNAKAQAKMIEDILDVSRITSGKVVLDLKRTHLATVIQNAVESIRPASEAKGICLAVELPDGSTDLVADDDRLQQIVWNLLSNAVKFTAREGEVRISATRERSTVNIRVEDTGRGISAELLPFVFDRFRQGDASTTKSHGGLGLGLAIVRSLVELHGGTISAHSEGEGRGARFDIVLPVSAVEPRPSAPASPTGDCAPTGRETAPSSLAGVYVLVVDDEDDARDLVATVLQEAGAEVVAVSSVAAALTALPSDDFTVVVSDVGMPTEDGYSLMRRIRSEAPGARRDIPALALTAFARAEDRQRALDAGFQEHASKPIDPDRLVETVGRLARTRRPTRP